MKDDTKYILPPLNINPDTIMAAGFSGGSFYSTILHLSNSETIKGVHLRSGGPYSFGYSQSGKSSIDEKHIEEAIALAKELSDAGDIDSVSNLKNSPVNIIGGLSDTAQ